MTAYVDNISSEKFTNILIKEINAEFPSSALESATVLMMMEPPSKKALPHIIKLITTNANYFANIRLTGLLKKYNEYLLPYYGTLKKMESEEETIWRRHRKERLSSIRSLIQHIESFQSMVSPGVGDK